MSVYRRGADWFTRRAVGAGIVGGALWGGLVWRLGQLQIAEGEHYARLANENRIRLDPAPARRGVIYDRFGQKLASNKRSFYVTVVPEETKDLQGTVDALGKVLGLSQRKIARVMRDSRRQARFLHLPIVEDISWEEFSRVNVQAPEFDGVYAKVGELRSYPMGEAFAHAIGYVGRPNQRELDDILESHVAELGLAPNDAAGRRALRDRLQRIYRHPDMRMGKQGLEHYAESFLRGEPGFQRVAVNAQGRIVEELDSADVAPRPGGDIVLAFDAEIQKFAIERFGEESGASVVLDLKSGDIVAMVSTPAFDPNKFVSGISQTDYSLYLADEKAPLYHKAYDGLYPPGSTFKMVVAAAALESGAMRPEESVYCGGHTWFGGRAFHCWKRGGHGSVRLHTAIQKSCDVYFYEAARRAGVQAVADMARRFGLGQVYDLGMTGGAKGVVPDPAWKVATRNEQWFEGETLNFGIGQGYLTTSPLQLAVMTARIARGAAAPLPRLIIGGAPTPDPGAQPYTLPSDDIIERLRAGMYAVTSEPGGTALRSGDLGDGVRLSGKTGTAQVRRISTAERRTGVIKNDALEWKYRDHALFVSFAPSDNPRYACVVVVDHGGGGSAVAAPIARDILKETLGRDPMARPVFTVPEPVASSPSDVEAG